MHTTELYSDASGRRRTRSRLSWAGSAALLRGYVVENANSTPFATTVLIIMAALSALGTLTLRETMGERLGGHLRLRFERGPRRGAASGARAGKGLYH